MIDWVLLHLGMELNEKRVFYSILKTHTHFSKADNCHPKAYKFFMWTNVSFHLSGKLKLFDLTWNNFLEIFFFIEILARFNGLHGESDVIEMRNGNAHRIVCSRMSFKCTLKIYWINIIMSSSSSTSSYFIPNGHYPNSVREIGENLYLSSIIIS